MARNKSEKSPSGDPMVDEALRAWLRLALAKRRGDDLETLSALMTLENRAYFRLDRRQTDLRTRMRLYGPGLNTTERLMNLYGHEPEFQDGTQQK